MIGWVLKDTAAAKAGFEVGDRITRVDGIENPTWEQVGLKEMLSPGQPLDVQVERNGKLLDKTVVPEPSGVDQIGFAGWAPKEQTVTITDLVEGMPADKGRIERRRQDPNAWMARPMPALAAMIESLKITKDKPITLTVLRDGQRRHSPFSRCSTTRRIASVSAVCR